MDGPGGFPQVPIAWRAFGLSGGALGEWPEKRRMKTG